MSKHISDNPILSLLCPCGSGNSFSSCCERVFEDHTKAVTPLMLMRSRYSAYALGNISHLLATWDEFYKPPSLELDNACKWLRLEIVESSTVREDDTCGYVRFRAFFIEMKTLIELSENSRFIRKNEKWYYQEGETVIEKSIISLKSPCPCGSGKKFKRCCM